MSLPDPEAYRIDFAEVVADATDRDADDVTVIDATLVDDGDGAEVHVVEGEPPERYAELLEASDEFRDRLGDYLDDASEGQP